MDIIQKLDDEPNDVGGLTAAELKYEFDRAGNIIKGYINNTLLPAISDTVAEEEARAQAEAERVQAESERKLAESERIAAESQRVINEQARVNAEQIRLASEDERISAEQERKSNEQDRVSNEQKRVSAEQLRISAEEERAAAEAERVDETNGVVARAEREADAAEFARKAIENMDVYAVDLPAGTPASVQKGSSGDSVLLTFGIPQGQRGVQGIAGPVGPVG